MPRIIPIRDLKDTAEISRMCHEAPDEPILVTKNGYQDMVIVSPEFFEEMEKLRREKWLKDVRREISEGQRAIDEGRTVDAFAHLEELRKKYEL